MAAAGVERGWQTSFKRNAPRYMTHLSNLSAARCSAKLSFQASHDEHIRCICPGFEPCTGIGGSASCRRMTTARVAELQLNRSLAVHMLIDHITMGVLTGRSIFRTN